MVVLALRRLREESSPIATTPSAPDHTGQVPPDDDSEPARTGRIGWMVAASLAAGLIAALLLVIAPFIPEQENDVTGAVLWGFASGWAMLAVLSVRFSDQPLRWAVVPAVFMGVSAEPGGSRRVPQPRPRRVAGSFGEFVRMRAMRSGRDYFPRFSWDK